MNNKHYRHTRIEFSHGMRKVELKILQFCVPLAVALGAVAIALKLLQS